MAARRNTRNNADSARSLPWGPMLLSFAVGAFVMFLLHLNDNVPDDKASQPSQTKQPERAEKRGVEPKFDFYTLLPEMEVMVDNRNQGSQPIVTSPSEQEAPPPSEPVSAPVTQPPVTTAAATPTEPEVSYMIQVGSFKKLPDADAYRAKLALLGIESKVQSVTIDNKDTWHRVQIGPISGRDKADAMQRQLKQNNIDSLLMRAKHG